MNTDNLHQENYEVPTIYPSYSWQVKTDRVYVFPSSLNPVEITKLLDTAQKGIVFPVRMKCSFPMQTIQPKIQKDRIVMAQQLPRDVEMERKRKFFASINFEELLEQFEIDKDRLIPIEIIEKLFPKLFTSENIISRNFFLPLEWFDNIDFDIFTEIDWLRLGFTDDKQYPIPAIAFIPNVEFKNTNTDLIEDQFELIENELKKLLTEEDKKNFQIFVWRLVAVQSYDEKLDKWLLTDLETYNSYKIHRIYIKFMAESPFNYAARLMNALKMRENFENVIKFQTVLDSLVLLTNLEKHPERLTETMLKFTNYTGYLLNDNFFGVLLDQVNTSYQRIIIKYEFENFLRQHPRDFQFIKIIDKEQSPRIVYLQHPEIDLRDLVRQLNFNSIFYIAESVVAMSKIATECLKVESMLLFACTASKPVPLNDFITTQQLTANTAVKFLKGMWVDSSAQQICLCLRTVGKGWTDITTNDWSIYPYTKMYKFLAQVKLRMESALRTFIENSMNCYMRMLCLPCKDYLAIIKNPSEYEWTNDFLTNPFKQYGPPVFYLIINLTPDGYIYSTKPGLFLPAVRDIFHNSLTQTSYVALVDDQVMTNLVFAKNLYLDCGDSIEEQFHTNKTFLIESFKLIIVPLKAYGRKYNEFVELFVLVIPEYIAHMKSLDPSAQEIKEAIINQQRKKQELIEILPLLMIIGPFFINIEPLKTFLVDKRQKIVDALLVFFTERMREITENLIDRFNEIYNKLNEKANSIEHVYEIKDFILTVPEKVSVLEDKVKIMMLEYDILDIFFYNLSDEQFGLKWETFAYPHKIFMKITITNEQCKDDIEIFKKHQIQELASFQDRLESINEEVSQFSQNFDPEKAQETYVDARKLWRLISDMRKLGVVLQSRQVLFELDDLKLDFIDQIVTSFTPYYKLWTVCVNFLKLEELCMGNALVTLDMNDIKKQIEELISLLEKSKETFSEKVEFQLVAEYFLKLIEEFRPSLVVMEYVKDEHWLPMHWIELSQKAKIEIKYSIALNLQFCIKKGILNHVPLVQEICERAILEADSIQRALEEEERLRLEEERIANERKSKRKCRTDIL